MTEITEDDVENVMEYKKELLPDVLQPYHDLYHLLHLVEVDASTSDVEPFETTTCDDLTARMNRYRMELVRQIQDEHADAVEEATK